MLHKFLTSHRAELIRLCQEKVEKRYAPSKLLPPALVNHGIPLFLKQLTDILRMEQLTLTREKNEPQPTPADTDIAHAAAFHGAELLRLGYSIGQVVHEYGDVCQAVTEMAVEKKFAISSDEFRTLNRCLDNAIADAVSAFAGGRSRALGPQGKNDRLDLLLFLDEHERLVDAALKAFGAISTGNVGLRGPTGNLLLRFLEELRSLPKRTRSAADSSKRGGA